MILAVGLSSAESRGAFKRNRKAILLGASICVAVSCFILLRMAQPEIPEGVSTSDYDEAAATYRQRFNRDGDFFDVLMTLAETAAKENDFEKAIACYQRIPAEHARHGRSARYEEAQVFAKTDQVQRAEDSFVEFLRSLDRGIQLSDHQVAHARRWLSLIYSVELRIEDRRTVLGALVRDQQADINDAKQYFFESLLVWQSPFGSERIQDFLKLDPTNRHLRNAEARYLIGQGRLDEAQKRLTKLYVEDPNDLRTVAFLLECVYERNDWSTFATVLSKASEVGDEEPWLLTQSRGQWALHRKEWGEAEKHFRRVLEIDRPNAICLMGLTKAVSGQGKQEESRILTARSGVIAKLRVSLATISSNNSKAAKEVADMSRQLGMEDAAAVFDHFAANMRMDGK